MCRIIRKFHPVGQGLFCSERFLSPVGESYNVVYDCGSETPNQVSLKGIIEGEYRQGEKIDGLFISHFDRDHVNGIKYLAKRCNIAKIYLPVLSDVEVAFWELLSFSSEGSIREATAMQLLERRRGGREIDLEEWVMSIDRVVDVPRSSDRRENADAEFRIPIRCLPRGEWLYLPYNRNVDDACIKTYRIAIKSALDSVGLNIDLESFIRNPAQHIKNISTSTIGKVLTKINKSLRDTLSSEEINANSMMLYSGLKRNGPEDRRVLLCRHEGYEISSSIYPVFGQFSKHRASGGACLYFGDFDTRDAHEWNRMESFFRNQSAWDEIGMVQVPHHGSIKSFNPKLSTDFEAFFAVSHGYQNRHRHPHKDVLDRMLSARRKIFTVSEGKSYIGIVWCCGVGFCKPCCYYPFLPVSCTINKI